MRKMKFIYISETNVERLPKGNFKALRLSKKDKEKKFPSWSESKIKDTEVLYPQTDNYDDNKIFVNGLGWKKFGKTNVVDVPVFSGNLEDWEDYLNKYGRDCLFYSISGYSLDDADCCAYMKQVEFLSLLRCGVDKYQTYAEKLLKIQDIQRDIITDMFAPYCTELHIKSILKNYLIQPCLKLGFFITSPYLDTIKDDAMLETLYRKKRYYELERSHDRCSEYQDIVKKKDEVYKKSGYDFTYYHLAECANNLKHKITEDILKQIDAEINGNDKNLSFPICMKERMTMLFGKDCADSYQYVLDNFKF